MNSPPQSESPVVKKVEHTTEMFGDVRIDNYYWLRDDSRTDPEVLSHLRQENACIDSIMSGTKEFENKLYAEIRGRIKEEDVSAPIRKGDYYYYERTLEGKEDVQHCRRLIFDTQKVPSVHDTMPTGPEAPKEHVILDENVKAQHHQYYSIGALNVRSYHYYPHILVTAGLNDTRVLYSEPAKLRETKTDANILLFKWSLVLGILQSREGIPTPIEAESWALLCAIQWILQLGYSNVIFESDCG